MLGLAPIVLVLFFALALGYLAGGRVRQVPWPDLERVPLIWLALGLQVAAALSHRIGLAGVSSMLLLGSYLVAGAWLVCTLRSTLARRAPGLFRYGIALALAGVLLNAAVVGGNGGMPVSQVEMDDASLEAAHRIEASYKHVPMTADTHLPAIADRLSVGGIDIVFSLGDLLLWAGLALAGAGAMAAGSHRSRPA